MTGTGPLIGINTSLESDAMGGFTGLRATYWEAVVRAGGVPLLVPQLKDSAALDAILDRLQGFIMIGGDDIPGGRFGEATLATATVLEPQREASDFALWERWPARRMPALAICLALQELNVLHGGSLFQDLPFDGPKSDVRHFCMEGRKGTIHDVTVEANGSLFALWDGAGEGSVNSFHHQAVKKLGAGLRPLAYAPDGILEALEVEGAPFVLAVQWHPERMTADPRQMKLFETLVGHALESARS